MSLTAKQAGLEDKSVDVDALLDNKRADEPSPDARIIHDADLASIGPVFGHRYLGPIINRDPGDETDAPE